MKSFKLIALSAFLTVGAFCTVLYTSCSKDECKDVVCQNGGTCNGGNCTCPTGWYGSNCQSRAFIGTWAGEDACSAGGPYTVTLKLDPSSTDSSKVLINNPGGFGTSITITGSFSSDSRTITYTNQIIGAVTLSGSMNLTDNTHFTHAYSAIDATTTVTCTGNYAKQ